MEITEFPDAKTQFSSFLVIIYRPNVPPVPETTMPPTFYERLGGAARLRELVDRFYDRMDTLPAAREIRKLHPENLDFSREKLFLFLCGWMGGPPLYVKRYGHPRLRARHLAFPIGARERDQWLICMTLAMRDLGLEPSLRKALQHALLAVADHMRNQPEIPRSAPLPAPADALPPDPIG